MKSLRIPLVLALLCLLLGSLLIVLTHQASDGPTDSTNGTEQNVEQYICRYPADKVSYLRIINSSGSYSLQKKSGEWKDAHDAELPLCKDTIQSILSGFEVLSASRILQTPADPSEYGLDSPSARLVLVCDGVQSELWFGDSGQYGCYLRIVGRESVYLVRDDYRRLLELEPDDLYSLPSLPDFESEHELTFSFSEGGSLTVDRSNHPEIFEELASLTISGRAAITPADASEFGMESPIVCTVGGTTLTFGLGESNRYSYLKMGSSDAVYILETENASSLLELWHSRPDR